MCKCNDGFHGDECSEAASLVTVGTIASGGIIGIVVVVVVAIAAATGGYVSLAFALTLSVPTHVVSSGMYAYSQKMATGDVAPVMNNPLYTGKGNEGYNPLFKASS